MGRRKIEAPDIALRERWEGLGDSNSLLGIMVKRDARRLTD